MKVPVTDGPHTTPEFVAEGVPFLSVDAIQFGELTFEATRFVSETDATEFRSKAAPRRGDLLMGKAASTGKIAQVKTDLRFCIWSPLALIRIAPQRATPSFIEYLLKSTPAQAQIDDFCTSNTQKNISMADIQRLSILVPPLDEQRQIAEYLDRETGKIDELITKQEQLVATLAERRQAVIAQAVTRGLDPTIELRETGVYWLRQIPTHWTVRKFSQAASINGGQVDPRDEPFASMTLIAPNHIEKMTGRILDTATAGDQGADSGKYLAREGQVIYSKIRPGLRKAVLAPFDCLCSADMYAISGAKSLLRNRFLHLLLLSEPFSNFVVDVSARVAIPKVNRESLAGAVLWFPSLEEQDAIVDRTSSSVATIDLLVAKAGQVVETLRERRGAFISAAVTGKIDVRGL